MADISAIFGILLLIGVAFPGMLTACWLLFPSVVERARVRVEKTSVQSFWLGLMIVIAISIPVFILLALPFGPAKFIGWILLASAFAVSSLGLAGIAAHLGSQLVRLSKDISPLSGFVRGAVVLELAAVFPIVGWLFIWPLMLITAFGATGFALLHWLPREKTQVSSATASAFHA